MAAQDAGFKMFFRIDDYSFAQAKQLSEEKSFFLKEPGIVLSWQERKILGNLVRKTFWLSAKPLKNIMLNCGFSEPDIEVLSCGLPAQFLRNKHSN